MDLLDPSHPAVLPVKILRILLDDWEIWVDEDKQAVIESSHSADARTVAEYFGAQIRTAEPEDLPEEVIWELPYEGAEKLLERFPI